MYRQPSSIVPSTYPSYRPSEIPSIENPSSKPSSIPSYKPSNTPSSSPSTGPSLFLTQFMYNFKCGTFEFGYIRYILQPEIVMNIHQVVSQHVLSERWLTIERIYQNDDRI